MPFSPPVLDDRNFDDLVEELVARIPAHTPEWTNPRLGDPGRTLIELFAWLTDTLLYRANLIPERQRLVFLRLLGIQMRPALAGLGLITVTCDVKDKTDAITIRPLAGLARPVPFETRSELTLLPVTGEAYYKRRLTTDEEAQFAGVLPGLQQIYRISTQATPYVTTPVFVGGAPEPNGFDLVGGTVDASLWVALLTLKEDPDGAFIDQVRATLGTGRQLLSAGIAPTITVPGLSEDIGPRSRIPYRWDVSYVKDPARNQVDYANLDLVPGTDTTNGLTRRGTMRLVLPAKEFIGAPTNDVRSQIDAGVDNRPPRLDDPKKQARLVCWLRLRPAQLMSSLSLSWVGINAVEIDQRQTITGRVVAQSDGTANQEIQLPGRSIEVETLQIEIAEPGQAYLAWARIDDLALAGRDDLVYTLDGEAGTIRFGDGVHGRIPLRDARVRAAMMRAGGGLAGNLPPGSLTDISARHLDNSPVTDRLKVQQSLPTEGGDDAETLAEAEQRIPALFRHGNRAVTEDDYRQLAAATPGVRVGRVEVLRRFKPQQRRPDVPGVVSVMVLPYQASIAPPDPRPDRPFLETVFAYLDARRVLSAEMYVIGCEYVALGVSAGITVRDGFGREAVVQGVRDALRQFLWPLMPGGLNGGGWELGRAVSDRELEVVVARVAGVQGVSGVRLFNTADGKAPRNAAGVYDTSLWQAIQPPQDKAPAVMSLEDWQLPELLGVVVDADGAVPEDMTGAADPFAGQAQGGVAVPVVPEVC